MGLPRRTTYAREWDVPTTFNFGGGMLLVFEVQGLKPDIRDKKVWVDDDGREMAGRRKGDEGGSEP